jgi:hypothetical protein
VLQLDTESLNCEYVETAERSANRRSFAIFHLATSMQVSGRQCFDAEERDEGD